MAHNFKIKLYRTSDNLHIHLMGDFDGISALELINAIKENQKNAKCVQIDTCKLKEVYPFGQEVFNYNLLNVLDRQIRIEFIGPNALQITPPGYQRDATGAV
jgi:hypothetical protein